MRLATSSVDQDVNKAADSGNGTIRSFLFQIFWFLAFALLNMVRITCRTLLRGAVSILCWLFILASFIVPMCIVGYVLIPAFSPPGGIVRHELAAEYLSNNTVCTPLWPDNFDYGVKVYASLESDAVSNTTKFFESDAVSNTTKFFESAQLLWHVDSVSASKKYPKLASSVVVDVPDMLYSIDNRNSTLYAHIFIQAADNLLPHPNIDDTTLVYTTTKLVHWRPVAKAVNDTDTLSPKYELIAATKVPWAIYLENYTYKWMSVPAFVSKAAGPTDDNNAGYTYKPPVLDNTFTETAGKVKQLALLQSNGTLVSDFDSTASVQLKLQGVRRGWIMLREMLDMVIKPTDCEILSATMESGTKDGIRTTKLQITLDTNSYSLLLKQSIVSMVTVCVLFICTLTMLLIYLKILIAFWWGPKTKWNGVSRATFFIQYSSIFVDCAQKHFNQSTVLAYGIVLLCVPPCFLSMLELPYNPLQWREYITGKIALYKQASMHNSHDGADKDKPEQSITTIRRNVDSTAWKWIRSVYPPIIVAVVFHALAYNTDGYWGIFEQVVERSFNILGWICFVPQIILNHKARSGSLIPPTLYICSLCITILFFGCQYIIGLAEIGLPEGDDLIPHACYIVFIIQWVLYR